MYEIELAHVCGVRNTNMRLRSFNLLVVHVVTLIETIATFSTASAEERCDSLGSRLYVVTLTDYVCIS